jgi:hypothetical protein
MGTGSSFPGVGLKWPVREAEHSNICLHCVVLN